MLLRTAATIEGVRIMGNGADERLTAHAKIAEAKTKGYEGIQCDECGQYTIAKNGDELICDTCGAPATIMRGDETNDVGC